MKGKFFWIALCVIGISWIMNSMYAHSKKLNEPIFLDHYIETVMHENLSLSLYYLTNINDSSSISYVNIDGITGYVRQDNFFDGFAFNTYPNVIPYIQTFTHYALRNFQLELSTHELENSFKNGQFTFNEIDVFFNNGNKITAPIGEVTILSDYPKDDVLYSLSGSSSSDGDSTSVYSAEEALSIESITMNYSDAIQDQFLIKINSTNQPTSGNSTQTDNINNWDKVPGTDIQDIGFPYELEKDEKISIYTQIKPEFIGVIESFMKFSGTTTSGKAFTAYSPGYTQQPYLEQKDVDAIILKKRGNSR